MKKTILLFMLMGVFAACKNSAKNESSNEETNPRLIEFYEKSDAVLDKPAKPSKISDLLILSGARLMPEKMNDPANWESYTSTDVIAAVNMGVYLADAIVQYAYDEKKRAYNSAIAAKSLSEHLGIEESVFMGYLIGDRYREEGGQSDSLFFVLDSALMRANESLTANERFKLLAAMYIGNYLEKQFIISSIIHEYNVDLPEESKLLILRDMLYVLSNSLSRLDYIIEMGEKAASEDESGFLIKELKELRMLHENSKFTREQLKTIQATDIFENEALKKKHEKIVSIRGMIVAPH